MQHELIKMSQNFIISKCKCIYIALFFVVPHTHGTQAYITQCNLQLHQCLPWPRKRSPDGASPDWGCGHRIAAYYSFIHPKRMKGWVCQAGWPTADSLPTHMLAAVISDTVESSGYEERLSLHCRGSDMCTAYSHSRAEMMLNSDPKHLNLGATGTVTPRPRSLPSNIINQSTIFNQ